MRSYLNQQPNKNIPELGLSENIQAELDGNKSFGEQNSHKYPTLCADSCTSCIGDINVVLSNRWSDNEA